MRKQVPGTTTVQECTGTGSCSRRSADGSPRLAVADWQSSSTGGGSAVFFLKPLKLLSSDWLADKTDSVFLNKKEQTYRCADSKRVTRWLTRAGYFNAQPIHPLGTAQLPGKCNPGKYTRRATKSSIMIKRMVYNNGCQPMFMLWK